MSTCRILLLLSLLPACGSNPAQPNPPAPAAATPAQPAAPAPQVTAMDVDFLIGSWAPMPDAVAIDKKVDEMVAGGMDEGQAVMSCYQSRFVFREDGSCDFGISVAGKLDGSTFDWVATTESPERLALQLSTDQVELPRLTASRQNELLLLEGDPLIAGTWVRLEGGAQAEQEDQITGSLAIKHIETRKKSEEARQEVEGALAQRRESFEVMVKLVKTICEAEDTLGSKERTQPIRNADFLKVRESMAPQEALLMSIPVSNALQSPVRPQHQGKHAAIDDAWLAGVWTFHSPEMDWEAIIPESVQPEMVDEMKKFFESRRRTFHIRGTYLNTLGWPEVEERIPGYYCLTPGAGAWSWVTILQQFGSPDVGIERDEIETYAAYRVGDVLWLEEGPGYIFPYVRARD